MTDFNQPTKKPTTKVTAGAIGGVIATLGVGAVAIASPEIYSRVPPGFEGALATGLGFTFAYLKRERA